MIYVPSFSTGFRSVSSVRAQIYETASFESLSSDGEQGLLCFTGFCCVSIFFIFKYHFRRHVARRSRRRPSMTSCSMARVFPVSYVTRIRHQIYPPPPPLALLPPPLPRTNWYRFFIIISSLCTSALRLLHYSISSRFLPNLFDIESRMGYGFGLGMDSLTLPRNGRVLKRIRYRFF